MSERLKTGEACRVSKESEGRNVVAGETTGPVLGQEVRG